MKNDLFSNLQSNQICIYGLHPSASAINNPKRNIYKVIATSNASKKLHALLHDPSILEGKIKYVDNKYFHNIQDTTHQGIIVIASKLPTLHINAFLEKYKHSDKSTIVLLDEVTDPRNIGAIMRSAVAFNAAAIFFVEHNAPSETSSMIKASAGSIEHIDLIHVTNLSMAIKSLKKAGFWILGLDAHTNILLDQISLPDKKALVLGSEGKGIRKLVKQSCDFLAKIPMQSRNIESLNISNAAAIALYELQKNNTPR